MDTKFLLNSNQDLDVVRENLAIAMRHAGYRYQYEDVLSTLLPALAFDTAGPDSSFLTKFGGDPLAPIHFTWPRRQISNRPLAFIVQIDVREMKATDRSDLLPWQPQKGGLLSFFYDLAAANGGSPPGISESDRDGWKVFYFEDRDLVHIPCPGELLGQQMLQEYPVKLMPFASVISELELASLWLSRWRESDQIYYDSLNDIDHSEMLRECSLDQHKAFGYGDYIQDVPFFLCEWFSKGNSYRSLPFSDKLKMEKLARDSSAKWISLLQLRSDESLGLRFGDDGRLHFLVKKDSLSQNDFTEVWVNLESR